VDCSGRNRSSHGNCVKPRVTLRLAESALSTNEFLDLDSGVLFVYPWSGDGVVRVGQARGNGSLIRGKDGGKSF